MNWIRAARGAYSGVVTGIHHGRFREMIELDRETACKAVLEAVERMTPQELEAFEQNFLTHSANLVGQAHRMRAMEIYACLKVRETQHYGQFRGFRSSGDPVVSESVIWNGLRLLQRIVGLVRKDRRHLRTESRRVYLENPANALPAASESGALDISDATNLTAGKSTNPVLSKTPKNENKADSY